MEASVKPKVSVIMPVYNGELFVEQALDSLFAQSFQDWELIIVDDGSTDSTPQILRRLKDERVKVIRQDNSGEATARNTGLENAKGEYIAFLDADDSYLPNALEDLSSFLDLHPEFGVVYSNGHICDSHNRPIMTLSEIRPGFYTGNILEQLVISSSVVTVPVCTMTRRSEICEHFVQFDRNLVIGPDWDFWIQLGLYTGFGYLNTMTCCYRVHNTNITRTVDIKKRRRDQVFGRLKVMNSSWFSGLTIDTKERFFYDLLLYLTSGDPEIQTNILNSSQFNMLPNYAKAYFLRMVSIDILQNDQDVSHAQNYLRKSLQIEPNNRKSQFLFWSMRTSRGFTLGLINFWRLGLYGIKNLTSVNFVRSRRLKRLLGVQ